MREKEIRQTYRFLGHKQCTELRIINPFKFGDVQSIFVYNEDDFVSICKKFNGVGNVYVGINERTNGGTKSEDIVCLNAVVFDIDPVRPRGLASNEEEQKAAYEVAKNLIKYLTDSGKEPALAMSGNGYQVWIKMYVRIDGTYKGRQLELVLKDMQRFTAEKFSTKKVKIDNIGDLARVIKVIGTKSIKVATTEERPNRNSKWLIYPPVPRPHVDWGNKLLQIASTRDPAPTMGRFVYGERILNKNIIRVISRLDGKAKRLFHGDYSDYPSRSEAEFGFLHMLKGMGLNDKESYSVMEYSGLTKWKTATDRYREHTIGKVFETTR